MAEWGAQIGNGEDGERLMGIWRMVLGWFGGFCFVEQCVVERF